MRWRAFIPSLIVDSRRLFRSVATHRALGAFPLMTRQTIRPKLTAPDSQAALGKDKNPANGLVAAVALNFSAKPISRASRPTLIF